MRESSLFRFRSGRVGRKMDMLGNAWTCISVDLDSWGAKRSSGVSRPCSENWQRLSSVGCALSGGCN